MSHFLSHTSIIADLCLPSATAPSVEIPVIFDMLKQQIGKLKTKNKTSVLSEEKLRASPDLAIAICESKAIRFDAAPGPAQNGLEPLLRSKLNALHNFPALRILQIFCPDLPFTPNHPDRLTVDHTIQLSAACFPALEHLCLESLRPEMSSWVPMWNLKTLALHTIRFDGTQLTSLLRCCPSVTSLTLQCCSLESDKLKAFAFPVVLSQVTKFRLEGCTILFTVKVLSSVSTPVLDNLQICLGHTLGDDDRKPLALEFHNFVSHGT